MTQQAADLPAPRFLDDRLAHWAKTKPDDEAMTYLDRTWTWAQWNDRVRRLAGALAELGVGRIDVELTAIPSQNGLELNRPAAAATPTGMPIRL